MDKYVPLKKIKIFSLFVYIFFFEFNTLPAVFPGCPDVFQFTIPHVSHREDEQIFVGVDTLP